MVHRFTAIVMLVVTLAVAAAPQLKESPVVSPLTGRWAIKKVVAQGNDCTAGNTTTEWIFTAKGNWLKQFEGREPERHGHLVDGSALTLIIMKPTGTRIQALHKVDGDELIVVWIAGGNIRPETLDVQNKDATVIYFARVKD